MKSRPDEPPQAAVFSSFSVFVVSVLALLVLAACSTNEEPANAVDVTSSSTPSPANSGQPEPAPQASPKPAPSGQAEGPASTERASKDEREARDLMDGVEEMVVTGTGGAAFLAEASTSVSAFDAEALGAIGASDLGSQRIAKFTPNLEIAAPIRDWDTERYDEIGEAGFLRPQDDPLSTFSIDVDTASYTNVRRFLKDKAKPPPGAVRIEELVNYFRYPRRVQQGDDPFAVDMEIFEAPWRDEHRVVRIAVEGKELARRDVPARNLVFLLDVSGSMQGADRLGLVKYGMSRLVESLRPQDRVSIVVYAGASGLVLPPTPGNREDEIVGAIERLQAGGSTAGASGIRLAYATARKHFDEEGINRVILATDGDFNVGVSNRSELVELIEKERESGVFLTVLGVGRGNLNDASMEQIADHGNGNYAYIDTRAEARRVLVEQADATLVTIAKDVKIQVEFNPERVKAYRLIGYENRRLANQDFNDDTKDAGEIGAGHHVTALYEIVPVGAKGGVSGGSVDPLKYQSTTPTDAAAGTGEWLTVKLRYKDPEASESQLVTAVLSGQPGEVRKASENARFSSAVALFGMLLRDSEYKGAGNYQLVENLASNAIGEDMSGERREFLSLVEIARHL